MSFISTLIFKPVALVAILLIVGVVVLHVIYTPVRDGTVYLTKASSTATLLREAGTGIHHIEADSIEMAAYTQGFAHA